MRYVFGKSGWLRPSSRGQFPHIAQIRFVSWQNLFRQKQPCRCWQSSLISIWSEELNFFGSCFLFFCKYLILKLSWHELLISITNLRRYNEQAQQKTISSTQRTAKTSAGSRKILEQWINDSSYPDGQWTFPSHHIEPFTQACNSGHEYWQSSAKPIRLQDYTA